MTEEEQTEILRRYLTTAQLLEGIPKVGHFSKHKSYAGAGEGWKEKIVPETIYGVRISLAAYIHDLLYSIWAGRDEKLRREADGKFLLAMLDIIEGHEYMWGTAWIRRRAARYRAMTYYAAVREHGESSWKK